MPDDLESTSDVDGDADAGYREPAFLNVSITPVEVSVICPRRLAEKYFVPVIDQLRQIDASLCSRVDVSEHDYIAMQVLGQGLEAGKRVVELTSPLAMAGMCVYAFLSCYSILHTYMNPCRTNLLTPTPLQLNLLHHNLLLRLHPRPPPQQIHRNLHPRSPRLPIRKRKHRIRQPPQ